jgi:hypothetical protein
MIFPMTNTTTAPQRGVLASFAFLLISMMLSGQSLAHTLVLDNLKYAQSSGTTNVEI